MAYKLSFPLDEFKKINSTLSEYYSEYFMKEKAGLIFGSSLNEYAFNIATISEDIMQKLSLDSILLHPNYLRTKINDCKKSMTYVETSEQSFRVYTFDEKIKDTPDMTGAHLLLDLKRQLEDSDDALAIHMRGIESKVNKYAKYISGELEFTEIPHRDYLSQFIADDVLELEAGDNNRIIVSRQLFPKYQRLESLSWASVELDDTYALAIFEARHPYLTMYTFVKYLLGI